MKMMDEQNTLNGARCYFTAMLTSDPLRLQNLAFSPMAEITSDDELNLRNEQSPERTQM